MSWDRKLRGLVAERSGRAAEVQVAAHYVDRGAEILETRWRSDAGEVDLIFNQGGVIVFVEVKSSGNIASAAASLGTRQKMRILSAAEDYLGGLPDGLLTEMRVDVALVAQGDIQVIENAMGL